MFRHSFLSIFLAATLSLQAAEIPTLYLIGDSTVNNPTKGLDGWGEVIAQHFDASKIRVVNRAIGGRSSRSYYRDHWAGVLGAIHEGDFVIIQFGHNDGGGLSRSPERASLRGNGDETENYTNPKTGATETVHSYGWYLRQYASEAKAKGASVIICSQIPRNIWSEGKVGRAASTFGGWAREAAKTSSAWFVDLNEIVAKRYDELGEEKVRPEFFTATDHTHTTAAGAALNAACLAEGIRGIEGCALGGMEKE